MKSTNFDYNGGFPFDQSTLKRLQDAVFEHIKVYALQIGCQETGNYILHGCQVVGANITAGTMFIDGEVCPFAGAAGDNTTKIKKQTNTANAPFENGTNPPVFIETIAVVNALGTPLQDYQRLYHVQDANYVHTDNNFTADLLAKLLGIEDGAEKNVQTNWNTTNPLDDSYLIGKPTIVETLAVGEKFVGSVSGNTAFNTSQVTFANPLPNNDYIVLGQINAGNGVLMTFQIISRLSTGFSVRFYLNDTSETATSVRFQYYVLPFTN